MSNCGKWLNKNEFTVCWIKAMSRHHNKALFGETSEGDHNRHWMYSIINECYENYADFMHETGSEDWYIHIKINRKTYMMYIDCDDHKGEYSSFKRIK